ncbi:hypothetical protein SKAU_G00188100 [Synaphobranchus kaupii]|uniref:Uncharacterized protein n=1 Tax=Synaphobranchus kaupii TaxID=118154 RepID=A0A9Q1FD56_SYNKA|nr:hypothetical protein SKAU_G00188100 [Synaphobranchus kaupii]
MLQYTRGYDHIIAVSSKRLSFSWIEALRAGRMGGNSLDLHMPRFLSLDLGQTGHTLFPGWHGIVGSN